MKLGAEGNRAWHRYRIWSTWGCPAISYTRQRNPGANTCAEKFNANYLYHIHTYIYAGRVYFRWVFQTGKVWKRCKIKGDLPCHESVISSLRLCWAPTAMQLRGWRSSVYNLRCCMWVHNVIKHVWHSIITCSKKMRKFSIRFKL